jgi:hypothetical protein
MAYISVWSMVVYCPVMKHSSLLLPQLCTPAIIPILVVDLCTRLVRLCYQIETRLLVVDLCTRLAFLCYQIETCLPIHLGMERLW